MKRWEKKIYVEVLQSKIIEDINTVLEKIQIVPEKIEPIDLKFYKVYPGSRAINKQFIEKQMAANGYVFKKWIDEMREFYFTVMVDKKI